MLLASFMGCFPLHSVPTGGKDRAIPFTDRAYPDPSKWNRPNNERIWENRFTPPRLPT
jgi:hypothetical protein